MTKFGKELEADARPEWFVGDLYVSYHRLKGRLKEIIEAKRRPNASHLVQSLSTVFQSELDADIAKVLRFYKQRSQEIQQLLQQEKSRSAEVLGEVAGGRDAGGAWETAHPSTKLAGQLHERMQAVQDLTSEVMQLLRYISLNMAAIRKILKKYAKHSEPQQPAPGYLTLEVEHPYEDWHLVQGSFLPARMGDELAAMQQHEVLKEAGEELQHLYQRLSDARGDLAAWASMRLPSQGEHLLEAMEPLLGQLREARDRAERDAALVHPMPWVERLAGMYEPPPPDELATATTMGLVVNNLSTLLYMTNYTAVIPPVEELCVRVGVSTAMAGYIVGASDAAAIFASVGVSYWTNFSFKRPLLFSGAACLVGNLLYCLSYQWQSLGLLLLARLFNGIGSARSANRRYTADYVGKARRTMASAAFVGCSNMGQALGPFLSLPLAALPEGLTVLGGIAFNPITAVGWIMAAAWLLFFLLTLFGFEDPPRRRAPRDSPSDAVSSGDSLQQPLLNAPDGDSLLTAETGQVPMHQASTAGVGGDAAGSHADCAGQQQQQKQQQLRGEEIDTKPLGRESRESSGGAGASHAWRATIPATAACTACLFVQKAVQQSYLDGVPLFSSVLYGWRHSRAGLFLAVVGLAMVPVNLFVGLASSHISDRSMVVAALLATSAGLALLTQTTVAAAYYFVGGITLFVGTVILEGTATSLMSKVIHPRFASGTLNAGLLSTEAGTIGRFTGNALLSVTGRLAGVGDKQHLTVFAQALHSILAASSVAVLAYVAIVYRRLRG
ncbi:hypothetical protein N2152v2_001053 [Parachlorella kessleri]